MGGQACIEADQATSLMYNKGKQVGVGDLAVIKEQLCLEHGVSSPRVQVRSEQVAWMGEHSLK